MTAPNAKVVPLRPVAKEKSEALSFNDLRHAMARLIVLDAKEDLTKAGPATQAMIAASQLAKYAHNLNEHQRKAVNDVLCNIQEKAMDDQVVQDRLMAAIESTSRRQS